MRNWSKPISSAAWHSSSFEVSPGPASSLRTLADEERLVLGWGLPVPLPCTRRFDALCAVGTEQRRTCIHPFTVRGLGR